MKITRLCTLALALAVATSVAAPQALASTGDLDPSFADHGRLPSIAGFRGSSARSSPWTAIASWWRRQPEYLIHRNLENPRGFRYELIDVSIS